VQVFERVTVGTGKNATFTDTPLASITASTVDGSWTTPSSIPLGNGPHVIGAKATDVAGNTTFATGFQPITIDTIAPAPTISGMTPNANGSVSLTGQVETGAVVSVFDLTKNLGIAAPGKTVGTWTFTTATTLTDTLHVFLTRAVDVAGNVSGIAGESGSAQLGSTLDDVLKGTIGNDFMTGGTGNDTFAMLSDFGKDVIADFNAGTPAAHDTINFHADALATFANVKAAAKQVGANTVITQGANTLTLDNVTQNSLIKEDFTYV
jgi:hypothetical protein